MKGRQKKIGGEKYVGLEPWKNKQRKKKNKFSPFPSLPSLSLAVFFFCNRWFSTRVPRDPWVPRKALGVPTNYELYVYVLVSCSLGCCQIVRKQRKGAGNQKRLRNTAIDVACFSLTYASERR